MGSILILKVSYLFLFGMQGLLFPAKVTYPRLSAATDIKVWHGKSGKELGTVDTNQLKNNMADISPNGRFIAAAAFTADVKVSSVSIIHLFSFSLYVFGMILFRIEDPRWIFS